MANLTPRNQNNDDETKKVLRAVAIVGAVLLGGPIVFSIFAELLPIAIPGLLVYSVIRSANAQNKNQKTLNHAKKEARLELPYLSYPELRKAVLDDPELALWSIRNNTLYKEYVNATITKGIQTLTTPPSHATTARPLPTATELNPEASTATAPPAPTEPTLGEPVLDKPTLAVDSLPAVSLSLEGADTETLGVELPAVNLTFSENLLNEISQLTTAANTSEAATEAPASGVSFVNEPPSAADAVDENRNTASAVKHEQLPPPSILLNEMITLNEKQLNGLIRSVMSYERKFRARYSRRFRSAARKFTLDIYLAGYICFFADVYLYDVNLGVDFLRRYFNALKYEHIDKSEMREQYIEMFVQSYNSYVNVAENLRAKLPDPIAFITGYAQLLLNALEIEADANLLEETVKYTSMLLPVCEKSMGGIVRNLPSASTR